MASTDDIPPDTSQPNTIQPSASQSNTIQPNIIQPDTTQSTQPDIPQSTPLNVPSNGIIDLPHIYISPTHEQSIERNPGRLLNTPMGGMRTAAGGVFSAMENALTPAPLNIPRNVPAKMPSTPTRIATDDNVSSDGGSSNVTNKVANKSLRNQIIQTILRPSVLTDITDAVKWRFKWFKIANIFLVLSLIMNLSQTIISFVDESYHVPNISFVGGCVGIISIAFHAVAVYAKGKSKEKTKLINEISRDLGINGTTIDLSNYVDNEDDKDKK